MIALHMGWRDVLFANWPIEPEQLLPRIPDALALDTHEGQAWVSIVAVNNVDVRSRYVPHRLGTTVPGVNLRTYVKHEEKPGVYFFSLDAQSLITVLGARIMHHLPYRYAHVTFTQQDDGVHVESERRHPGARPARFVATYEPAGERFHPQLGTLPHFLAERYRTYTQADANTLASTRVQHNPWPLHDARVTITENTLLRAEGLAQPEGDPFFLASPGLDAIVTKRTKLETEG